MSSHALETCRGGEETGKGGGQGRPSMGIVDFHLTLDSI